MLRWIAIGTAPGWDDVEKFGQEMRDSSSWRPDPRTTVTTVYALEDGRLLAEGQAAKRESFEAWLQQKGWTVESITPVKHVAAAGSIWEVKP